MRCGAVELAFSAESAGWQVVVDGTGEAELLTRLIGAIIVHVATEVGESDDWIQL